jgi:dihydrodiol dehydrogenase / D-xylose 1-dehydrogenase (NADP)
LTGVWTRFFPVVKEIKRVLHEEKAIGKLTRVLVDFSLDMPLDKQPPGSRVSDLSLGAGSLLDIGIYPLTWASILLSEAPENEGEGPSVVSALTFNKGVDEVSSVVLSYKKLSAQAICTATYLYKSDPIFARVEGTEGTITINGRATSKPLGFVLKKKGQEEQVFDFGFEGWGFFYEADAVARDIKAGKMESETMPLSETLRVMKLMDEVRRQNGMRYPQDDS